MIHCPADRAFGRDYDYDASAVIPKYASTTIPVSYTHLDVYKRQVPGRPDFPLMTKGVIIRHMVLPGHKDDSIRLLYWIHQHFPEHSYLVSLLSQYTPYTQNPDYPQLNRRITSYEYNKVVDTALELGMTDGFMQQMCIRDRCVSEGIRDASGKFICEYSTEAQLDTFGHKMLTGCGKLLESYVRNRFGVKVRSVELNVCLLYTSQNSAMG